SRTPNKRHWASWSQESTRGATTAIYPQRSGCLCSSTSKRTEAARAVTLLRLRQIRTGQHHLGPQARGGVTSDDNGLPEPLRSLCLRFCFTKGLMVIARCWFVRAWTKTFGNTCCDDHPARPVCKCVRHGVTSNLLVLHHRIIKLVLSLH